jgi:diguanylate cyclase (GGDEF)-like protein
MNKIKLDKKSIAFRVTSLVIIIIIAQAVLLTAFLIIGGVLSQAEENAYISFSDKVNHRKNYIQREMKNRWMNMDPYIDQISAMLSGNEATNQYFEGITQNMISMMRTTQSTGAFVILNSNNSDSTYPSLYLRDYDPVLNDYGNKDLYLVFGPSELAKKLKIPLDQKWKPNMVLDEMDSAFYDEPYNMASLTYDSSLLGYWSLPFRLFEEDIPIITFTMPLFDGDNKVRGVIGIEISTQYFNQFLPATDLQVKDSLGYFIGYKDEHTDEIQPILLTGAMQKRILNTEGTLSFEAVDLKKNIYLLENINSNDNIYVCIEEMGLYSSNTPFQEKQWYLIGMMRGNYLLDYFYKIEQILFISVIFSILIGIIGGYFISYRFTKPIIRLAKQVKESKKDKVITLSATGLTEVDELAGAMQMASNSLLESTVKMSRIIDLVGVPIGAFEYHKDTKTVYVTDQLQQILSIDKEEMTRLVQDKHLFIEKIKSITNHPEVGEDNVYAISGEPSRWVNIKTVKNGKFTLGVIIDVSEDMMEKKKIIRDRDHDPLTGIYNRKAFQKHVEEVLVSRNEKLTTAILMFDLDNLKITNDTYGHKWGDEYINLAVRHLEKIAKENMVLGRRSGDEFALLLYEFESKDAIRFCLREFYANLSKDMLLLPDGISKPVTISSGLAWVDSMELPYDEYLQFADEALYKAKKFNKGSYCEN